MCHLCTAEDTLKTRLCIACLTGQTVLTRAMQKNKKIGTKFPSTLDALMAHIKKDLEELPLSSENLLFCNDMTRILWIGLDLRPGPLHMMESLVESSASLAWLAIRSGYSKCCTCPLPGTAS